MYSYIDMHCDSLLRVLTQGENTLLDGEGMTNIQKMAEAGQIGQFFAIFCVLNGVISWQKENSKNLERLFVLR